MRAVGRRDRRARSSGRGPLAPGWSEGLLAAYAASSRPRDQAWLRLSTPRAQMATRRTLCRGARLPRPAGQCAMQSHGIIHGRYEHASIGLTTNLALTEWTRVFPEPRTRWSIASSTMASSSSSLARASRLRSRQAAGRAPGVRNRAERSV